MVGVRDRDGNIDLLSPKRFPRALGSRHRHPALKPRRAFRQRFRQMLWSVRLVVLQPWQNNPLLRLAGAVVELTRQLIQHQSIVASHDEQDRPWADLVNHVVWSEIDDRAGGLQRYLAAHVGK